MLLGRKSGFLILYIVTSGFVTMPTSSVEKLWLRLCELCFVWLTGLFYFFFSISASFTLPFSEAFAMSLVVGSLGTLFCT